MPRKLLVLLLITLVAALAGCGGGDGEGGSGGEDQDQEQRAVAETIATATKSRDPAGCERFYTQAFLERMAFGFEGEAALRLCEEVAAKGNGGYPREVDVTEVEVTGGEATASVAFEGGTYDSQTVVFALAREEDRWKIDRMVEFVGFDRERLIEGLRREVQEFEGAGFEAELIACMVDRFERLGDAELQDLALYNDDEGMPGIAEACVRQAEGTQDL